MDTNGRVMQARQEAGRTDGLTVHAQYDVHYSTDQQSITKLTPHTHKHIFCYEKNNCRNKAKWCGEQAAEKCEEEKRGVWAAGAVQGCRD